MSLDHYAPCPCGSGKKLKFCKCIDQPHEYEKILKLIEGEQNLAAVDRINQLLEKTPNAAWLLAIKGELTLGMQELESFRDTANRFLKLKPDNPLALVMKAIACGLEEEPVETVAKYLLDGMSESREAMPALTLFALRLLLQNLQDHDRQSLVGYWGDLYSTLTSHQPENDSPQLDPTINLLAKSPVRILEDPADAAWKERLAEVVSLTKTFRFAQAETKLRAILRDYPSQPGPLSHLLRAQSTLLDQANAFKTAEKLANHLDLSADDRAYFKAVSLELEPGKTSLLCPATREYFEMESEQQTEQILGQFENVASTDPTETEVIRRYFAAMVGDEIPAKRIYSIFNHSLTPVTEGDQRVIAAPIASVVIFGKQTDKPSRLLFVANHLQAYEPALAEVRNALPLGEPLATELAFDEETYVDFLRRQHIVVSKEREMITLEERGQCIVEEFLQLPLKLLGGQTPLEASADETKRADLRGLLFHLEGEQSLVFEPDVIDVLYERLNLERPKASLGTDSESIRLTSVLDLDRIRVAELSDRQLKGLTVRAMGLGAIRVFFRCAQAVQSRQTMADDTQLQIATLSGLLNLVPSYEERIRINEKLEGVLAAEKAPVGKLIIQRMTMLQMLGRTEEARTVLSEAVSKYPNDSYLVGFIQYAMQSQNASRSAGGGDLAQQIMLNAAKSRQASNSSGLVLPGQQNENTGGGKLWLPGS